MKHLKLWEEYRDFQEDIVASSLESPKMSSEEFETLIDNLFDNYKKDNDFEELTRKFTNLKNEHSYIKEEQPYKDIWFKYVKIWYYEFKKLEMEDPSIYDRITAITYPHLNK